MNPIWVGSKMPGKRWNGSTAPMLVLHTLEFNGWPSTTRWDSPSHFVYNPNTQELRQYVSTKKAAYSLRTNYLEDDYLTLQVELWGRAANTPNYSDEWYRGLAALLRWTKDTYGIRLHFADFSVMKYGRYAAQRMSAQETHDFEGILGHAHFGRGVDTHWDPGMLDIERLETFLAADDTEISEREEPDEGTEVHMLIKKGHPVPKTVEKIQEGLVRWDKNALPRWKVDSDFGSETKLWVEKFQSAMTMKVTGQVDDETMLLLS